MRLKEVGMNRTEAKPKKILRKMSKWTFQAAPVGVSVILVTGFIHSVLLVLQTICMQLFFEQITDMKTMAIIVKHLLLLAGVMAAGLVFDGVHNAVIESTSFQVTKSFMRRLQDQVAEFRAEYYEDAKFLDRNAKAEKGVEQSVFFMNVCFVIVTYYIPYFVLMGIYLMSLKPQFLVTLLLVFLPVLIQQHYRSKCFFEMQQETTRDHRRFEHYEACITSQEYFKETRILGAYYFFQNLYQKAIWNYDRKEWKAEKRSGIRQLLMKSITLVGYLAILLMFVKEVWNGTISIGAFVALFTSLHTMFRIMEELLCGHISRLSENYASICNYVAFIGSEPSSDKKTQGFSGEAPLRKLPEIRAEHISYHYPNSEKNVLKDLNFVIHQGETVAIVGENGAGKSTLLKILCGQYLPTEGELYINGTSTKALEWEEVAASVSTVFQNYMIYGMTLLENVAISESHVLEEGQKEIEACSKKGRELLKKTGFQIDRMPAGMQTMLFRQFDGIDLSTGQWQKIAIARGCFRERNLLILDEPTASIDPLEEKHLYTLFQDICQDKTAVIITHRLAAARVADRILVLDNHELIEEGTHEELIQKGGVYCKMYFMQKEMYKEI